MNEEAHIVHLWVFSPPVFVLGWDVKDIVQSSVKEMAASFRQLMLVMEILLFFRFVCLVSVL